MVSLRLQFFTFLNMIIVGMIIGVFFDLYQVLRGKSNPKRLVTDLFDILFSLLAVIIIFSALLYSNNGQVRVYVFGGVIVGLIIYYWLISKFVVKLWVKLVNIISWLVVKIKNLVITIYNKSKLIIVKIKNWIKSIKDR